ncbi:MAG: DUF6252 family protein [Ferruginibacter sp.]
MTKRFLALIFIICAIWISACQKEYNPFDSPITATQGDFTAKINGVSWVANVKAATRQGGVIVLYGNSSDKKSIVLRVADSGVHNYSLHTASQDNVGAYTDSAINPNAFATNQWDIAGSYGNVNITSIDTARKTMSGTFSMRVYRMLDSLSRTITEGVFTNIPYASAPPAPSGTDSFRVKVDGVPFSYNLLIGISVFGKVNISAAQNQAPAVGLSLPDTIRTGTYQFDIIDYIGQYNPSSTLFLQADTGTITILEHNVATKRIRGNFHFKANQPFTHLPPDVQLTEGYFSVKYQ